MPVSNKDYYSLMGLTRTATTAEVKKAFRKLARVHHPDVAKNKAAGEMMFKEIHEAYETLIDPLRRRQYDEAEGNWRYGNPVQPQPAPRSGPATSAPRRNTSRRVNFEEGDIWRDKPGFNQKRSSGTFSRNDPDPSASFGRSPFDADPKNKMPEVWFIRNRAGKKEGPFDFVELAALLRTGEVTGATAVRADGESVWRHFQERHEFAWARDMPSEIIYRHLNKKAFAFAESKPFTFKKIYYFFGLLIGLATYVLYFFLLGGGKFVTGIGMNYVIFKIFYYLTGGNG